MGSNELEWVSEERRKKAFNKQLCALMYKLQAFSQGERAVLVLSKSRVLVFPRCWAWWHEWQDPALRLGMSALALLRGEGAQHPWSGQQAGVIPMSLPFGWSGLACGLRANQFWEFTDTSWLSNRYRECFYGVDSLPHPGSVSYA